MKDLPAEPFPFRGENPMRELRVLPLDSLYAAQTNLREKLLEQARLFKLMGFYEWELFVRWEGSLAEVVPNCGSKIPPEGAD